MLGDWQRRRKRRVHAYRLVEPQGRIAVLASGAGSTMLSIADACASGELNAQICLVLCNRPDAPVLAHAAQRGIPAVCVPHQSYPDRQAFEAAMLRELRAARPDLVALAGFMRILTETFIREYYGSLLNIHPSLLPKYPGLDTHQRALDANDREAGSSVHFVIPELDAGPVIIQARVPVRADDTARTLEARVKAQEQQIYPKALQWCLEGNVKLQNGQVWKNAAALAGAEIDAEIGNETGTRTQAAPEETASTGADAATERPARR